jgi:mutator protein MutT
MANNTPRVGLGIIIEDEAGNILVAKRTTKHAPKYSIPGGKLEPGETFEQGAIREVQEEHGITIINAKVIAVTNNLETYKEEGVHSISIVLLAKSFEGEPKIMEPHKCSEILWVDPRKLPLPHFDASRLGVECYLKNSFYEGIRG